MKSICYYPRLLQLAAFAFLISCGQTATVGQAPTASQRLASVLDNYWQDYARLHPLEATSSGIHDYNDQLEISIGQPYVKEALAFNQRYLDSIKVIDRTVLTEQELLSVNILSYMLEGRIKGLNLGLSAERPVDPFVFSFPTRFATLGSGAGFVPFRSVEDYENFLQRMKAFSTWVDVAIANMNEGIKKNNTNPRASMVKVPPQLKPLFEGEAEANIFYKPVQSLPDSFSTADQQRLKEAYAEAITQTIQPAYKKLHDYLVNEYIPKARTSTGLVDNYRGKEEYQYWINYWTTTDKAPDEIFDLGIREVARIRTEMDSIKNITGFEGDLKAFFEFVKTDKRFFPFETEEEVLDRYRSFEERMSPKLATMFRLTPKAGFEVRATEKFREAGANAQYMRPAFDGSRPGVFYETVRDPRQYNYIDMEDLFIHEAIPGHHYQIALQQEMDLPAFRKSAFVGAYSEGWALYAESLGEALGMYKDPYQYLGRLSNDMERAVRLVVDVGMHHKGWTREQAIAYVLDNQPVTPQVAEQRIERYMVVPGQALSYKIGEQKILELRKRAQEKLGNAFDIRDFHDEILKDGAMPLNILDDKINRWIERTANRE